MHARIHTHTHICVCVCVVFLFEDIMRDARGVMVIVVRNGHGDTSSNPGRE